jgi:hypothetical protein
MVEITIFEVHFEDATFDAKATANAPLSSLFGSDEADAAGSDDGETAPDSGAASESGGRGIGKLLLVVALLGGLAALAARRLDREDIDEMMEVASEEIELDVETEPAEREADD